MPNILAFREDSAAAFTGSFTVLGNNFNLGLCAALSVKKLQNFDLYKLHTHIVKAIIAVTLVVTDFMINAPKRFY